MDAGSVSRAAEWCLVSQPALSNQLAELESMLGVPLFERAGRRLRLTPTGEILLERARAVLLPLEDLLDTARLHRDPLAGTIRLGVIPTLAPGLLPSVDPALRSQFPKMTLLWTEERTQVLVEQVLHGHLDGAFLSPNDATQDLRGSAMKPEPFVVAVPATHAWRDRTDPVQTLDLANERVLLLEDGHCLREQALEVCALVGAREPAFRATSLNTLTHMVAAGHGVTLLPLLTARLAGGTAGITLLPMTRPGPERPISLMWRPGSALTDALKQLARTAAEAWAEALDLAERPRA